MKESIGYSVTLNIVIVFIIIVFAFLSAVLIYFKSNKVSNVIVETIEKYEGYNDFAQEEIAMKLSSIGYTKKRLNSCGDVNGCSLSYYGDDGYCVYVCEAEEDPCYYYYRIKTNMMFSVPILNEVLELPIYSNTNRLYDFEKSFNDPNTCNIEGDNE